MFLNTRPTRSQFRAYPLQYIRFSSKSSSAADRLRTFRLSRRCARLERRAASHTYMGRIGIVRPTRRAASHTYTGRIGIVRPTRRSADLEARCLCGPYMEPKNRVTKAAVSPALAIGPTCRDYGPDKALETGGRLERVIAAPLRVAGASGASAWVATRILRIQAGMTNMCLELRTPRKVSTLPSEAGEVAINHTAPNTSCVDPPAWCRSLRPESLGTVYQLLRPSRAAS